MNVHAPELFPCCSAWRCSLPGGTGGTEAHCRKWAGMSATPDALLLPEV